MSDEVTRRAWVAFRKGVWQTALLLRLWQEHIEGLPDWRVRRYEGYNPITVDVTAFWRPALKNCPSKHYHPAANRALPAVIIGITGQVGDLNGHRVTTTPDETIFWQENGREIRAEVWHGMNLNMIIPNKGNRTFDVYGIFNPNLDEPWLLATPVGLQASSVRAIYRDRWPVEQIPLSAKQMLGAHRQFVHADESIQRLPELALLAGSILSFLAVTVPAIPTGFWDRKPKRTPGRLRRTLIGQPFPKDYQFPGQLRKKNSVTAHLPKGNESRFAKTPLGTPFGTCSIHLTG